MQNPDAVALKEDMRRTRTRLHLAKQNKIHAEKELDDQNGRKAKLQQDLDRVSAGMLHTHLVHNCLSAQGLAIVRAQRRHSQQA